jgi:hypothetical protein
MGKKNAEVVKEKKTPPTGKRNGGVEIKVPKADRGGHKANGKDSTHKKWVGKPNEWRTVLRLPDKLAPRLKKAADKNGFSVNEALKTLIEVWVKQEHC